MNEVENSKIISDFLRINGLLLNRKTTSKLPKFISDYRHKKDVNKLLKNINKLRNSNYIFDTSELIELFTFINNNFDTRSYKSIIDVKIVRIMDYNTIESVINLDEFKSIIRLRTNQNTFELVISDNNKNHNVINIEKSELKSSHGIYTNYLNTLNNELKNIMCDFLTDIISEYKRSDYN